MGTNQVRVDSAKCLKVAEALRFCDLPAPNEPWGLTAGEASYDLATLNLILVAICHQTQFLSGKVGGVDRRGWDYLQTHFQEWAQNDANALSIDRLSAFTVGELQSILQCGNQLSPTDLSTRAGLVRNCGEMLRTMRVDDFRAVYRLCEGRIGTGSQNLLAALRTFVAFDDPVRKKSLFLLGLNEATCGWVYADPKSLASPVDYHEVRGHLRIGTVVIDDQLRQTILTKQQTDVTTDVAIRAAVTDAMRAIADASGYSQMQLHYSLWNLFRNACTRQRPKCFEGVPEGLPAQYRALMPNGHCCLAGCCDSAGAPAAIDEHCFETTWY